MIIELLVIFIIPFFGYFFHMHSNLVRVDYGQISNKCRVSGPTLIRRMHLSERSTYFDLSLKRCDAC